MSATMAASATPVNASASSMDQMASQASASEAMKSISSTLASASAALSSESKIAAGSLALPSFMKDLGIALAVGSGFLIGASFVFKKKGLISAQKKYNTEAGESMQYLKSPLWWTGMIMMILGEVLNLVAYAVTSAVLVTPLGALSVVVSAILSSIFLKEKLTLFGKIGCFLCIVGSTVIALNGPEQHAAGEIRQFQKMFISVGFLVWGGICIAGSLALIFFVAPRYGKRYMLVYISICSLIGGLSVSTISGVGSAIVLSVQGVNQFNYWFIYFLIAFVIVTLLTEIVYLNKALELFNTAMVTPTYYVLFTFSTLVTSIILFQGLDSTAIEIVTIVLGFLTICAGITLLQLSKIDPDDLVEKEGFGIDRSSTLLIRASRSQIAHEKGQASALEDPGIDTVRGGLGVIGSIVRARSSRRIHASADEYHRMGDESANDIEFRGAGLNTLGKRDVERYELHDRPMPGSPAMRSPTHLTLPAMHMQMPRKRDTAISFASGSEEPHGHHGKERGISYEGSKDITSPLSAQSATFPRPAGGILLSPTSSSQGANLPSGGRGLEGRRVSGNDDLQSGLEEILESTDHGGSQRSVSSAARSSIRVIGPRPESSKDRDLRTMFDPSQSDATSTQLPVGRSPGFDADADRSDYMNGDFSSSPPSSEDRQHEADSPVRRKRGGSRTMFGIHHGSLGRSNDTANGGLPNDGGVDEDEGLLSPSLGSTRTIQGPKDRQQGSGDRRR